MPPTRRRRPVQPATRVRLPRAARAQPGTNANGTAEAEPDETALDEAGTAGTGVDETGTAATDVDDAATEQAEDETDNERWPSGRRRDDKAGPAEETGGEPGPADDTGEEAGDGDAVELPAVAAERAAGSAKREPILLPVCLGVATVVLGGLAIWFGVNAGSSSGPAGFGTGAANAALTNSAATNEVNRQIDTAVDTIFSYNYADTAKTAQAAKTLLTGKASGEYATLFKVVQQNAPTEKLVLTTTVTNSGVEMLNGNTARLLIFANQKDTGATKGSTTEAGTMFSVTAVHQDGQWKIEDINTFSAPG